MIDNTLYKGQKFYYAEDGCDSAGFLYQDGKAWSGMCSQYRLDEVAGMYYDIPCLKFRQGKKTVKMFAAKTVGDML